MFVDTLNLYDEDIYAGVLRFNQIFLNLIGNAVKFTNPGGSISIRICQKPSSMKGYGTYQFIVRDTGIGMHPSFVEHIFEPFERERNSTASGIEGTGLGMTITKNIVDMMGGTIDVKSEVGRGTEFKIELNFRLQDLKKTEQEVEELKGLRALVVDDDFNTCDSITKMMKEVGMRSEWTLSGREAVLRARKAYGERDAFFAYIIDWLMPDINGIETARQIRKEVGDSAPIIILTAYDWADIEEEAKDAGVTAFCNKPLFMSELRETLLKTAGSKEQPCEHEIAYASKKFKEKKILVVEDNELNREIAVELLSEAGFKADEAVDGLKAVKKFEESEINYYDLILMDIQMPNLNGYEATKQIRRMKREDAQTIPVIAMTANAFDDDKQNALDSGMTTHIAKPLDIDKLFVILSDFVPKK